MKSESNPRLRNPTVTNMNETTIDALRFDVAKIAATLPETATTLLVDHYLTNREAASARVFRAIDTPRRDPKDIVFVNPEDGTPESFIRADQ
jgi:hypothetical protein